MKNLVIKFSSSLTLTTHSLTLTTHSLTLFWHKYWPYVDGDILFHFQIHIMMTRDSFTNRAIADRKKYEKSAGT